MRTVILSLVSLLLFSSSYAQKDSLRTILYQGVALDDKGDYQGAVRIYDQIIKSDENYYLAYNEKSLSLYHSEKYQESIGVCKTVLKKFPDREENEKIYTNYGSSLDALGQPDEAIKIYNEGIGKYPESYLLPFNRAITEYNQKKYEAAIADLKSSINIKPDHASGHLVLAYCVYEKNKIAAVLALSTFLLLEPEGQRAQQNLKMMLQLLSSNVAKKDEKNITISVSPGALDGKDRGEDDFHQAELMISLRSALDYDPKYKDLPLAKGLQDKLSMIIPADDDKRTGKNGFFTNFYIPFLQAMKSQNLLETACYLMCSSSDDAAVKKWLTDNKSKTYEFNKWIAAYKWNKG